MILNKLRAMPKLNFNNPIEPYKSISDTAKIVEVEPHVLRFWEKEFSEIKPHRNNGRRCYLQDQIDIILTIKSLLYEKGYTLQGAKQFLKEKTPHAALDKKQDIESIIENLYEIKKILQ